MNSPIFKIAEEKARQPWGNGWSRLTVEQQRNAVAFEILALGAQQDEAVSAERIRQINADAYSALVEKYPVFN